MTEPQLIEGEVAQEIGQAMELATPYRAEQSVTLFRTDEPAEVIAKATALATTLKQVLSQQRLTSTISGKEHVRVEGWTLLGTMLGVFPVLEWTKPVLDRQGNQVGWEARVLAKTLAGATVGAAEAECLRSEKQWKDRDDFALKSMSQTRATSKALRQPLGFVVTLAGFEATPAEEMTFEEGPYPAARTPAQPKLSGWKDLEAAIRAYGDATWEDWMAFGVQAREYLYPEKEGKALTKAQKDGLWTVNARAAKKLLSMCDPAEFPPPNRVELREAWMAGMEMEEALEGPPWRMSPEETDRPPREGPVEEVPADATD